MKQRISEYGITELRYIGLIVGAWLLVISVRYTLWPGGSTRAIPFSLALIFFLSAAGPWSAFSISSASQKHKLLDILAPFGAVENGGLVPAKRGLTTKDEESVRSILSHLITTYGSTSFPDLLVGYAASQKEYGRHGELRSGDVYSIIVFIKGNKRTVGQETNRDISYISVEIDNSHGLSIDGYHALYHANFPPNITSQHMGDLTVEFDYGKNTPKISLVGKPLDVFAVKALLESIVRAGMNNKHRLPSAEMSVKLVAGSREWLLVINKLEATSRESDYPYVNNLDINLLQK